MSISKQQLLEALRRAGGKGLSDKELLRALGADRKELRALRGLLRGLVRSERLERTDGRFRLAPGARREARRSGLGTSRADRGAPARRVGMLHRGRRGIEVRPYPDDRSWVLSLRPQQCGGARIGDVIELGAAGDVVEVLGRPGEPRADFEAIVAAHGLIRDFPGSVLSEVESLEEEVPGAELERRVDLRSRSFVTIDPETARDHDDAVFVEPGPSDAMRLWVAIADVAHYVRVGSAVDAEAARRGNSVYFPDRAIPMLPERLSSQLCSLRPDEDRLAIVAELEFDRSATLLRRSFYPATIRSRARLTYREAASIMQGETHAARAEVHASLRALADLAERLMRRRFTAGSIDFDLPSAEIVLGDEGHPVDIVETPRSVAHRAVEEAMLATNRAVSETLSRAAVPALYRIHEPPDADELDAFYQALATLGLLKRSASRAHTAADLGKALARVAGRPEARVVHLLALRAMRQACYDSRDRGHFALAFPSYTHFTSPIRRYADLVVHRALIGLLEEGGAARSGRAAGDLTTLAGHLSNCERRAMVAEREMVGIKKCAFMKRHLGEEFWGTVTGVARHGLFVTLDGIQVDGLVHKSRLGSRWRPDTQGLSSSAGHRREKSHRRYRLGDRMRVRVEAVEIERAWVRLAPAEEVRLPRRRQPPA